jgi:hypothetical protein
MNENIDRLAIQCYQAPEFDYKKFAELIIKEYEQLLPEHCPWAKAEEKGPTQGWHVAFVARKHFGVEQ